jgi:RNA polymerase sigma factor (sigma-70 family)
MNEMDVSTANVTQSEAFWVGLCYSIEIETIGHQKAKSSALSASSRFIEFPSMIDERRQVRRALMGDERALFEIVQSHQPILQSFVRRYRRAYPALPEEDLNSEAQIALMEALRKFDLTKGVRFVTYLKWSLLSAMQEQVANFASPLKIPRREFLKGTNEANYSTNVNASDEQTQFESDSQFESDELHACTNDRASDSHLRISKVGLDSIAELSSKQKSVLTCMLEEERDKEISERFALLDPKSQRVVSAYFGFDGEPSGFSEIAKEFDISRQRVGQILKKALSELKGAK